MKVKALIEVLSNLPEEMEVVLERKPDYNYEAIPVINAEVGPVKIGEYLCQGSDENCQCCEDSDGYCIYDLDGIQDVIEEHVIIKLGEKYKEIENKYEDRNYNWYYDRNNDKSDKMKGGKYAI